MKLTFKRKGVEHHPLNHWELSDGNTVVIYQGTRGANPDLDFIIKYKSYKSKLRAPSHTHWIVDLIMKTEHYPSLVTDYLNEWIEIYDIVEPFKTTEERNTYQLYYNNYFTEKYSGLQNLGSFSVEFLSSLIELFIKCEKQSPNAFMFKNLLKLVKEFSEGKKDFYQIVSYSKRV
jgi:hypothetical protein